MFDNAYLQTLLTQFQSQIDRILLVLERSVVQRQLVAFAVVVLVAWALPRVLRRFLARTGISGRLRQRLRDQRQTRTRRVLRALDHTYSPVLGVILGELAIRLFDLNGWRFGLIQQWVPLFWVLLAYRLIVAVLYAGLEEAKARIYHRRFLIPAFILLVGFLLSNVLTDPASLAGFVLLSFSDVQITIGSVVGAIIVLYLFIAFAWAVQDILDLLVLPRTGADTGVSHTILTISRYSILAVGFLAALGTLGFSLSSLAIIGGGLSIGIGFGLQALVANFVSGILLLFEQSVRPGDIIEVNNQVGTVEKLRIRSTMIRTLDNVEIIVPNENLLTSSVTTFTQTSRIVRVTLPVGVSYNSDPQEVRDILERVADRHGLVIDNPAPRVFFARFGDSSLDFELTVWIDDPRSTRQVLSDLHHMVWEAFERRNIEIPFPQRDLHLRSGVPWERLASIDQQEIEES